MLTTSAIRKVKKALGTLAVGAALVLGSAAVSQADITEIQFDDQAGGSGFLVYPGGTTPMFGFDIFFDVIQAFDGVVLVDSLDCVNCTMNFQTGNFLFSVGNTRFFGGGGSIQVFGDAQDPDDGGASVTGGPATLLEGDWDNLSSFSSGGQAGAFVGFGDDLKNEDILDFFGASNPFTFANTEISASIFNFPSAGIVLTEDAEIDGTDFFAGDFISFDDLGEFDLEGAEFGFIEVSAGGFRGTVINADLNNFPVPEPGTLGLLGLGLSGLGVWGRRRRKGSAKS